jgi:hypothetical protein
MDPKQINIDQIPKQFCEKMLIGSNNQFFVVIPIVGANATAYAITPEHAKSLVKTLSEHVAKFETNIRPIPDMGGAVPSPIQTSDLPPHDGGEPKK